MTTKKQCPDGGTCHHGCETDCFRVKFAGPLSGVYPGNAWPAEMREENGARWRMQYENIEEVVEERIHTFVAEEYTECEHLATIEDGKMVGRGNMWVCSDCIARITVAETRRLIADEIEQMAVEYAADPAVGVTSQSLRAIRVEWVREVARRVALGAK